MGPVLPVSRGHLTKISDNGTEVTSGKASLLTRNEKRAAVGYGPAGEHDP
jgi:hypothetical protein